MSREPLLIIVILRYIRSTKKLVFYFDKRSTILFVLLLIKGASNLMVPENYIEEVKTGGDIEKKYLALGKYKVEKLEKDGSEVTKKFHIYYPSNIKDEDKEYPVIVMLNGTGVMPKQYRSI